MRKMKGGLALLSAAVMMFSALSGVMVTALPVKAAATVNNPRIADDGTVTWDKITFGSYPQDMDEMVKTPIKWRILDIDSEGNAFLLADEAIDCKPYNENGVEKTDEYGNKNTDYSCTWETCSLRDWLNGTDSYVNDETAFIKAAFTEEERNAILDTTVVNDDNTYHKTKGGNDTTDKVYLLSIGEASNASYGFDGSYFDKVSKTRQAKATDYAYLNGVYCEGDSIYEKYCYWWLRSPGDIGYAARVCDDGKGDYHGYVVDVDYAVRPVLNVNLSSSYVKDAGKVTSGGEVTVGTNQTKRFSAYNKPLFSEGVTTWDCVYFGNYRQNASIENKAIEWRVLSVNGNDAFVLADKALDCKPYNVEKTSCTWETCTLRDWLNGTDGYENDETAFIKAAFTEEERNAIIETTVINEDNPSYKTEGGNNTTDKVYLLSIEEISNTSYGFEGALSSGRKIKQIKATDYAYINGALCSINSEYTGNCRWLLRSPGFEDDCVVCVWDDGYVSKDGSYVYYERNAVCPVLHVDLTSSYVKSAGTVSVRDDEGKDEKEAYEVIALISSIGTVTKDSKEKIEAARTAYNALSESAKLMVTNYGILTGAEKWYDAIIKKESSNTGSGNTGGSTGNTPAITQTPAAAPAEQTVTAPSKVTKTSAKNVKKKSIVVKWERVSDAKGYELQYALNKKFTKSKKTKDITSASKVSFTVTKLKKNKTYYVRVRAYNQGTDGKKVYGKWSDVKKVKIKK